ncbi:MAG: hypothetical protein HRT52_23690 [Colwellia sp.]|nr:hypothetical protein [Colwellia sp.]
MKKLSFLKKSIALFILPSLLLPCYAASNYIGIDYVLTDIKIADESAQPTATAFTIGTSGKGRFENMYFEAQYLKTHDTDNIYRIDFDLEQSTALYLLLKSASRDGYSIDVAVGYAYNDLTLTGPENTYNGNEQYNGFSWKAAINYQIPYVKNSQIKLGYQSLYNKDGLDISGISLGISYHF